MMRAMTILKMLLAAAGASALLAQGAAAQASSAAQSAPVRMEAHEAASDEFDPAVNKRLIAISENLRCLVCQNQTIADSNAELAIDLRRQVREQLAAGRTDEEIIRYMTDRYGDFVLYKPPFKATTVILWLGPAVLLVLVLGGYLVSVRRRRREAKSEQGLLTEQERREARRLLGIGEDGEDRR